MSLLSAPDGGSFVDGDTFSEMFDRAVDQITAAVSRHLQGRAGRHHHERRNHYQRSRGTVMSEAELSILNEIMSSERICMLVTTTADGRLHAHPMTTQETEYDGSSWFLAKQSSETVRDLRSRPSVNVSYSGKSSWLSIAGTASVVDDPAKKAELWNTFTEAWFPDGRDDPDVVVVRVAGESAEYWDSPGRGAMVVSMVKSRLTAGTPDSGDSGTVDLTKAGS